MIASIEANGWVLRVTLPATPGSFASYILDPDGAPRVQLTSSHAGFAPSAGIAVATTIVRNLVATKPLRKPVDPASPTTPVLDEVDNGDGTVTVRLALSDFIHASDTELSLSSAANWRTGEAAATISVSNGSTFVAAMPIFRWADVPYQRQGGPFTLELIVFSHHPNGVAPVAGVRFSVTDGTTVKTGWATALSNSTRYGDTARVYAATFDPATATALTAGLLRCDAEIFPWLGNVRSTDAAGTRSMTGLATAGYASAAEAPFVIGYDPAGTRYAGQIVYIDPAGSVTATAAMVQPTLAAAKAVPGTARAKDINTALQALYLAARPLPAANGQTGTARACDGARLVLAAGTHVGAGTTSVTTTLLSLELPVIVEGDPDDPNPRTNIILQTGTVGGSRANKILLRNLSLEIGGTTLFSGFQLYYWLDNIEIRGKAGSETSATLPIAAGTPAGSANIQVTRSRFWRSGTGFRGSSMRIGLLRNCEWSRRADAICFIGGRFIPGTEDVTQTAVAENGLGSWTSATDIGALEDVIIAGVDLRSVKIRAWAPIAAPAATAGTPNPSVRRQVFANNLCERIGSDPTPFWSIGEDSSTTASYLIIEGNSFVGERCNIIYGDPLPTTVAETNSQVNQAFGNRVANNSFDWAATKHDAFNDSQSQSIRGGTNGYRPQMTETWSVTYGVGFEGNYDWGRHSSAGNFRFEYFGRRSVQLVGGLPGWPADRSSFGSPATGGGTYKPPAGSPLIGRALQASVDRDRNGSVRTAPFASGAIDTGSTVALAPAGCVSASLDTAVALGWFALLDPAAGGLAVGGDAGMVGWSGAVVSANGVLKCGSGGEGLTLSSVTLFVTSGRLVSRDAGAAVLPDLPLDLVFATPRQVRVSGEFRVQLVPQD